MNEIKWEIGNKYPIIDISCAYQGELIGFILNQQPVNWENKDSWRNHPNTSIYLVFKLTTANHAFCISKPTLSNSIGVTSNHTSRIVLGAIEYGNSIDQLIRKLQENYVFSTELSYDAKYKEGYVDEGVDK